MLRLLDLFTVTSLLHELVERDVVLLLDLFPVSVLFAESHVLAVREAAHECLHACSLVLLRVRPALVDVSLKFLNVYYCVWHGNLFLD